MAAKRKSQIKTYLRKIGSKRQITIPAEVFRELRLQIGDKVYIRVIDGQLHLTFERRSVESLPTDA